MPTYKLYYFLAKGRAESTRWLFAVSGVPYEDIRVSWDEWPKFKPKIPFGQLPALDVDGQLISQSGAINRLLAKRIGLVGSNDMEEARINMIADSVDDSLKPLTAMFQSKNDADKEALKRKYQEEQIPQFFTSFERFLRENKSGFFVGSKMTWVDIAFVAYFDFYKFGWTSFNLDKYPLVKALEGKVTSHPKIADWIKTRPVTDW